MLRTRAEQVSGWEAALPPEVLRLPEELARVDVLLDDPVFFAPFAPFFDPRLGRPSTPIETYLRLMFLKFRYRLGYESLCREVADSISWRRFCRIRLDGQVPNPTTLMKLTTRCGPAAEGIDALAAAAPGLRGALLAARAAGHSHLTVDGTLIRTDRCSVPGPTVRRGRPDTRVEVWWSGKHGAHGGNIQVLTSPDGWPIWTSPVRRGREHDTTCLG